jgi:hypothetical protein
VKIKLTIAGKEQELTIEDAKTLHAELSKVFGKTLAIKREREMPQIPVFILPPSNPPITPFNPPWKIICQSRS